MHYELHVMFNMVFDCGLDLTYWILRSISSPVFLISFSILSVEARSERMSGMAISSPSLRLTIIIIIIIIIVIIIIINIIIIT